MSYYLSILIEFIKNNENFSYFILFLWGLLDTLFPIWFFIYWEIFFLSGSILAWVWVLNIFYVAIVLYLWWIIWDSLSYYIWYKYWNTFLEKLFNKKWFVKIFKQDWKQKLLEMLEKKWWITIFLTRVGWPLAWITPFVIWSTKYSYLKFIKYNIPGVIFWISIFISAWYFFGTNYQNILNYIYNYIFLFLLIATSFVISYTYIVKYLKLHKYINIKTIKTTLKRTILKAFLKHTILYSSIIVLIYLIFLYFAFFVYKDYKNNYFTFSNQITDLKSLTTLDLNTSFYKENKKVVQPINFVIVTKKDINQIVSELWWIKNKIIQKDDITLTEYFTLYNSKTLPITNLVLMWKNQDFWYQMNSKSNSKRIHLRWWNYWTYNWNKVYLITISNDKEYEIDMYNNYITPIHEIDRDIDKSRDFLLNQFLKKEKNLDFVKVMTIKQDNKNYFTDWYIYIINI